MKNKEIKALVGTAIFLIISVLLYYIIRVRFNIVDDNISFTTLLVLPVIVYLMLSDKLKSFKAGNFEATFKDVANSEIKLEDQDVIEGNEQDVNILEKGAIRSLRQNLSFYQSMDDSKKYILLLRSGFSGYNIKAMREYVRSLANIGNFKFVVIIDQQGSVISYVRLREFASMFESDSYARDFMDLLQAGNNEELSKYPGFITKSIGRSTKNIEALDQMEQLNMDALLVVDNNNRPKGIIEREKLATKLLLSISKGLSA